MTSEHTRPRVGIAVPAAGVGRRMGGVKKPWLELDGEPILAHALRPFLTDPRVAAVAVALAAEDAVDPPSWLAGMDARIRCVAGGASRAASVARAVEALPDDVEVILVHDAARPLVDAGSIDRCVRAAASGVGAVVGLPAIDTFKEVAGGAEGPLIVGTPDRSRMWHAQTPQGFPAAVLRQAVAREDLFDAATDDASLVEAIGGRVIMVEGHPRNLKVTRPEDLPLATFHLAQARAEA